jgi:hypothetical protein
VTFWAAVAAQRRAKMRSGRAEFRNGFIRGDMAPPFSRYAASRSDGERGISLPQPFDSRQLVDFPICAIGIICSKRATGYLKSGGIAVRPPGGWGRLSPAKQANNPTTDAEPDSKPCQGGDHRLRRTSRRAGRRSRSVPPSFSRAATKASNASSENCAAVAGSPRCDPHHGRRRLW